MVNCTTCGGPNDPNARFCVHCGARLSAASPAKPARDAHASADDKKRSGKKSGKKKTLGGTLVNMAPAATRPAPGPAARSMSEALEGALAAVGAPAPAAAAPAAPPPAPTPATTPLRPPPKPEPVPPTVTDPSPTAPEVNISSEGLPLEQVLAGIDDGFESIVDERSGAASGRDQRADDMAEPQAIFRGIAATHMRPVRDFIIEVRMGEPSKDWVTLCLPAMTSLRKSAEGMSLPKLCQRLDDCIAALQKIEQSSTPFVSGKPRDALTKAYSALEKLMPDVFALSEERDRREPIIVQSLLGQVPGVRAVALDKLYSAGLTSLSMFYAAKPEDIAAATGLSPELSGRIVERFSRYREETAQAPPDIAHSSEQAQLTELIATLRKQHEDFQDAADSGGSSMVKRRLRRERADTLLRINVLMARLGEVERLDRVERLPFDRKLAELDLAVSELKSKFAPPA